MKNRIKIFLFLLLTPIFSNYVHSNRCSIVNELNRTRPETAFSAPSPSGYFLIHYEKFNEHAPSLDDQDLNDIPDYVDEVGIIAEHTRNTLIYTMGFLPEIPDSDGIYDIYIQNRNQGEYGVNFLDSNAGASYIVIDNEYEPGSFLTSGLNTMRFVVAHEFFHAIQRAYRPQASFGDTYFWEMSATWIEDVIVPDADDYILLAHNFFDNSDQNISSTDGYSIALFGHYLATIVEGESNQLNSSIMRKIWERYDTHNNPIGDMEFVLINQYNMHFHAAWSDFCARSLFNGVYNNMDNDIYYYTDQRLIDPLDVSYSFLNEDKVISNLFLNNQSSKFKGYQVNEISSISLLHELTGSSFSGFLAIKSNNTGLNRVLILESISPTYYLDPNDFIYLIYSSLFTNSSLTINIDFENNLTILSGDVSLDGNVNISDIILLRDFILNQLSLNQIQLNSSDINSDSFYNIFDLILIVEIILN